MYNTCFKSRKAILIFILIIFIKKKDIPTNINFLVLVIKNIY